MFEGSSLSPLLFTIMIKILAIDQARNGAWSIFDYENKKLLDYGTFEYPSEKYTFPQAIMHIEDEVVSLVCSHSIDAVFIEDIQSRTNIDAFKKLACLYGVLINYFERDQLAYGTVYPATWQSFIYKELGFKRAELKSKELSLRFVKEKCDLETNNDNLSDAICIGWYVVNNINIKELSQQTVETGKKGRKKNGKEKK